MAETTIELPSQEACCRFPRVPAAEGKLSDHANHLEYSLLSECLPGATERIGWWRASLRTQA